MIERGEEPQARALPEHRRPARPSKSSRSLSLELEKAKTDWTAKKAEKEELLGYVDELKKEREQLTREADRVERVIEQKDAALRWPGALVLEADGFPPRACPASTSCRRPRSSRSACPS